MVYKKDPHVRYWQMAAYIDKTIYTEARDDVKIYEYLCLLYNMLAVKGRIFGNARDYDNFSYISATRMYCRLTNPRQFLPEGDPKKLKVVKNVLDYMKSTLYPYTVDYEKEFFDEVMEVDAIGEDNLPRLREYARSSACSSMRSMSQIDIELYLSHIGRTVKSVVYALPQYNKLTKRSIYISCMLTFLNQITWDKLSKVMLSRREDNNLGIDSLIDKLYRKGRYGSPVLYHLEDSMSTFIVVLTNRVKDLVRQDLIELIQIDEPTEDMIKNILASAVMDVEEDSLDD